MHRGMNGRIMWAHATVSIRVFSASKAKFTSPIRAEAQCSLARNIRPSDTFEDKSRRTVFTRLRDDWKISVLGVGASRPSFTLTPMGLSARWDHQEV